MHMPCPELYGNACSSESALLFVREVSRRIQHDLKSGIPAPMFKKCFRILIALDYDVKKALRDYHIHSKKSNLVEGLVQIALKSLHQLNKGYDDVKLECSKAEIARKQQLAQEADEIEHLLASMDITLSLNQKPLNLNKLKECVSALRCLEVDIDLQARLAFEVDQMSESSEYSDMNFSYGSTPLSSWIKVIQDPAVKTVLSAALHCDGRICMVWGSSLGWLVFYAALTIGCTCWGYELLCTLHEFASGLKQKLQLDHGLVQLQNADLLVSDLSNVGVLVLTNQCWDAELMQKASTKLALELPENAVIIEYCQHLTKYCDPKVHSAAEKAVLEIVATVPVPVSWNDSQIIHVYRKVAGQI
ncbi:hypothetical protein CEUSTIGMA_g1501.t1 [Chlamydomonas eustigma]|uniref:Uncharacterized protein n=1 Tax=Chlamydomonas eustigma TaxID=1157962 RepID=A0A250WTB9_9CHLO|nr:hypothetical protein CEUSTIGMA_g1501.t1 [Chlamydomonas eustigma]|eukprot:GAX74051.1 hypothetical protein CEUSTIGMA_g1501.t1 [Chlamydomonas eustigma]